MFFNGLSLGEILEFPIWKRNGVDEGGVELKATLANGVIGSSRKPSMQFGVEVAGLGHNL